MAKSPRKSASLPQTKLASKSYPRNNKPTAKKSNFAGKATKYYHANKSTRRFSIVDSSSSDSEKTLHNKYYSSDSESSLTAVSEDETSTAINNKKKLYKSKKSMKSKHMNLGRKHVPKKSVKRNWNQEDDEDEDENEDEEEEEEEEEDDDDEEDEDDDDDDDEDEDKDDLDTPVGLEGLYSLMNTSRQSDDSASDDEDEDEEAVSSSDDDVDFVQLQAERKAARVALKTTPKPKSRANSVSKKFGRRKSNATLPEDINFTFDFDDLKEDVIVDDFDQVAKTFDDSMDIDEEDVGEEISPSNDPIDITKDQFADFDFDTPMIPVPKIKDEDLNSDDEYEFDDNELLATLHAENDMDEFLDEHYIKQSRNNSMGSLGEDDPFLKEETKFLVNEFENNGFDDELEDVSDKQLMDSFNDNDQNKKPVVQYESSLDGESGGYEDEDEDEFDDFVDFDVPIFDDKNVEETNLSDSHSELSVGKYFQKPSNEKSPKKSSKKRLKNGVINSDEEDDSYLWNYFFSSGESEDENNVERYNDASEDEGLDVDQLFPDMNNKNRRLSQATKKATTLTSNIVNNDSFLEYESGDSTDEDMNLPKSSNKKIPSKKAKEVLSSKTADYRPPVLGTWVAVDSKPFGIIDGLSTRTLVSSNNINKMEPRKGRKSVIPPNDDLALGLDELLNISELDDDDENDIKIWRDFNQKKQVPLGAFRNKSSQTVYPNQSNTGFNSSIRKKTNVRRNSMSSKPVEAGLRNTKSKQRRRSSIAEAVSEGFRPTKSGLFSENSLADIEEVLGDDNEFLALIKGI